MTRRKSDFEREEDRGCLIEVNYSKKEFQDNSLRSYQASP